MTSNLPLFASIVLWEVIRPFSEPPDALNAPWEHFNRQQEDLSVTNVLLECIQTIMGRVFVTNASLIQQLWIMVRTMLFSADVIKDSMDMPIEETTALNVQICKELSAASTILYHTFFMAITEIQTT